VKVFFKLNRAKKRKKEENEKSLASIKINKTSNNSFNESVFVLLRAQTLSLSLSLPFYRTAPDFVWKETKQKQRGREKERERNKNSKLFSRFFFFSSY
jgi:hypothetical protein